MRNLSPWEVLFLLAYVRQNSHQGGPQRQHQHVTASIQTLIVIARTERITLQQCGWARPQERCIPIVCVILADTAPPSIHMC
jgi:hypothetical protein